MGAAVGEVVWTPSSERREAAALTRFLRFAADRGADVPDGDYLALHRWSIDDLERFWATLADFFDVELATPPRAVLGRRAMPGAEWFAGATLSYPAHIFRGRDPGATAIVAAGETRPTASVTWDELTTLTRALAGALRAQGVGPGDRVAAYMPNVPETIAAFLASASLGATWASCSPDFGATAVLDRLAQIEPTVLFTVDGYRYGGRDFDRRDVVAQLGERLPTLRATVALPYLDPAGSMPGTIGWDDFLASGDGGPLEFAAVPFDHPLWVLYSSGTTGLPKGLVHGHGGILLEHLKWVGLQVDAGPGDRLMWLTTTGWTMWNFLVGGLLTGATIVLYDGNPGHPDLDVLWALAERERITCLGAGAAFISACMKAGLSPRTDHDLSALRSVGSTGSPLHPEAYDWVRDEVGEDVWLFSTSGGTDVCTAFVGGTPLMPVRRGEIQAPALGVDVQSWDEEGRRRESGVGELVIVQPMPSMPVRLWADPDGERYREAYFDVYPGVWRHGDWIEMTSHGGAIIHGRSDSTINRGGVRIGSAEVYRVVEAMPEVADAVVIDVPSGEGESAMLLYVVPAQGATLDEALVARIRGLLRSECSPRHVPDEVLEAPGVPRTLSGKVLETPLRRLMMGEPAERVASRGALANPEALDWFAAEAARRRAADAHDVVDGFLDAGGLRIHYVDRNPAGPDPLLLVHGANVQLHTWDPIADELADRHRVVAVDLRGHGDSDWAPDGYAVGSFVSDLAAAVVSLGAGPCDYIGHSLGARIGIAFAAEHPELVRRLVLSDTGPELAPTAARYNQALLASTGDVRGFRSEEDALAHYREIHPEWQPVFHDLHVRHQLRRNWAGKLVFKSDPELFWLSGSAGSREIPYLWEAAARIAAPTLILRGRRSPFLDEAIVERMTAAIPDATVVVTETGHYIPREDPEAFIAAVRRFLED